LYNNSSGDNNVAIGYSTLYNNTSGINNVAVGIQALYRNTTPNGLVAIGPNALYANTTGVGHVAVGNSALTTNTTGSNNTGVGFAAMLSNTTGGNSTAVGNNALQANTTGGGHVAIGANALYTNTISTNNVAAGKESMYKNTSGSYNAALGHQALYNNTTGSGNTGISPYSAAGSYTPVFDTTTETNRFCMGSTAVTNAYIQVAWTVVSDARDKTDFAPVPHGLDFISKLQPTAYRYKETRDATEGHGPLRYGFKAQEVLALEGDTPVIVDAEDTNKLRFNDQALLAVLVNAIKELKAEFDEYKASHP
jgi:hypothetical protein